MRFTPDETTRGLLEEVDEVLAGAGADVPARELFALLGDRRLVAVHYPEQYGGRGMRPTDSRISSAGRGSDTSIRYSPVCSCFKMIAEVPV